MKEFLKGIIIGIANIIPGVSGGTMAVSMGIYDKLISAITGLKREPKKSILTLLPYIVGAVVGIGALSFVVNGALGRYPLQTAGLFVGLILGGLPIIVKKVKGEKLGVIHIIAFLLFFALVTGMTFVTGSERVATDVDISAITMILLFFIGIIAAATMIIPGVSGSMVLMILGYYTIIINNISSFLKALTAFDVQALIHGFLIFIPFGLGILVGIGVVAKIIEILFAKAPVPTYYAILGLIIGSPIAILYKAGIATITLSSVLATIVTFAIGFCIAFFLGKEE